MGRITLDLDEEWEKKLQEYKEFFGWEDDSKAIRDMMAHGYVHNLVSSELKETLESLKEVESQIEDIDSWDDVSDEYEKELKEKKKDLEKKRDKLSAEEMWKYREYMMNPKVKECPACGEKEFDTVENLAQHISRKKDSTHEDWKEDLDLESQKEIKKYFLDQIEVQDVIKGDSKNPEIPKE